MKCVMCKARNIKIVYKNYQGYMQGTKFDIFKCERCDSHLISGRTAEKIYEFIYSNKDIPSYRRYYKYAQEIKKHGNPLKFLADNESVYFPIYNYLKDKPACDILDVGCGNGYLTYSLNCSGHKAIGIDISKKAINFALNNLGKFFMKTDIDSFAKKTRRKFDLIIVTELIEHLPNPDKFIKSCLKLLKNNGKIIITSPNKDYIKKALWQTDLPPVHMIWFGKKGLEYIARNNGLNIEFFNFKDYYPKDWNNLINFFIIRKEKVPKFVLTKDGKLNSLIKNNVSEIAKKIVRAILIGFFPIRHVSNIVHNFLVKEYPTLGAVMSKK